MCNRPGGRCVVCKRNRTYLESRRSRRILVYSNVPQRNRQQADKGGISHMHTKKSMHTQLYTFLFIYVNTNSKHNPVYMV